MAAVHPPPPGTLQTCFLVAKRFLLGAPRLRVIGASGCYLEGGYQLDVVDYPQIPLQRRRRKLLTGSSSSSVPATSALAGATSSFPHHHLEMQKERNSVSTPKSTADGVEPYHLEPVRYNPAEPPVPYWYDSPHFRPNA